MNTPDDHPPTNKDLAAASGMHIEVELIDQSSGCELLSLDIVPDEYSDFSCGYLGENTPLAQAICGHHAGESLPYQVDDLKAVHIIKVEPSLISPDPAVASRRGETMKNAVRQSDLANAIIFATSYSSKWGDYDPSQLSDEWEQGSADVSASPGKK